MKNGWRRLVLGYASATLVQGAVGFAIVPFLLTSLGQQAFAKWAMIEPLVPLLGGFALAGIHYASLHDIGSGKLTPAEALRVIAQYGVLPAVLIVAISAVGLTVAFELGDLIVFSSLLAGYIGLETAILLMQFQARAQGDAIGFALTVWIRSGVLLLSLLFLSWQSVPLTLEHYLVFMVGLDACVFSTVCWRHRKTISAMRRVSAVKRQGYWAGARYGLPIVVAAALAGLVANGDRYLVFALLPTAELPAYVVMSKLASAMTFAIAPIGLWWPVARHRHVQDADGGQAFFSSALPVVLAYYVFSAAIVWLLAGWLLQWYAPGVDGIDHSVLLLLLVGSVAFGMTVPVNIGALAPGKTHWMLLTTGFAAISGFGLAMLLIPMFGYTGAAIATLGAQSLSVAGVFFVSQRIQPVRINQRKLIAISVLSALLFAMLWFFSSWIEAQVLIFCGSLILAFLILRAEFDVLKAAE